MTRTAFRESRYFSGQGVVLMCGLRKDDAPSLLSTDEKADIKFTSLRLLKSLRDAVKLGIGPGTRKWQLVSETPVNVGGGALAYRQRWWLQMVMLP